MGTPHNKIRRPPPNKINPRPRLLLKTLAEEDLTLKQAANRLCMSIDTANQNIAAARKALGAKTTYAAVRIAMLEGLMDDREYLVSGEPFPACVVGPF